MLVGDRSSKILADDILSEYEGKELPFGFRPEAVKLGECGDAYTMSAEVVLTELLGDNTNVYVKDGENGLILKVDPHDTPALDTSVTFSVPLENVYIFDKETEKVIPKKA